MWFVWSIAVVSLVGVLGNVWIGLLGVRRASRVSREWNDWDREVVRQYAFAVWCRQHGRSDFARATYEYVSLLVTARDYGKIEEDRGTRTGRDEEPTYADRLRGLRRGR